MIVDKDGKPFNPSLHQRVSALINRKAAVILLEDARPSKFDEMRRIAALRESCGEAPGTITFRRFCPYESKP